MKIALICSAGGHLAEIMQLEPLFNRYNHFFISFKRENTQELTKKENVYFVTDPKRNFFSFIKLFFESLDVFLKEKPDLIISSGAGMAIPFCYIAKLWRKKIIFIESLARINEPSASGKIISPIADLFIIQSKHLKKHYPKAKYASILK
jgi:UDP-N-acetylglucosamine:LPS N-acetylglucosamine transferase